MDLMLRAARLLTAAGLGLGVTAAPAIASAESPCGTPGRPVVELVLEVEPPDRIIGTTLEQHLRAELGVREIDVCTVPVLPGRRSIARVTLHVDHPAGGAFLATIRIGDLIMDKRVERTIDLAKIPPDGRPLAVAASTDELLRASWMELTIPDASAPTFTPPPAVTRAISAPARPPPRRASLIEVGIVATAGLFPSRVGLGGELWVGLWVHPRVAIDLRLGADAGLTRSAPDGSARADTLGPGAGISVSLMDHDAPLGLRLSAGAEAVRVHLGGTASGSAIASSGTQWTGVAELMLRGWARTGPVSWTVGVGPVAAFHGVAATDNGATVTAVEGFGGKLDAGLLFPFP